MAALPLSNQYSLCTHPRPLHKSIFISQFQTKNLSFQSLKQTYNRPILGFSQPLPNSYSWRTLCAAKDTAVETSEDEAQLNDVEESESELTVKSLLQLYKVAILTEDLTTVSDIETTLYHLENEKNKLLEKVVVLSSDASSGKERYIRLQADFDNFRKRSEKEKLNARSDAKGEVIESLLPMVDNFERAKQQLKLETEQEKKIDASYQGIYKQFVEIMRSLRVAVVPTVGKPFDPSVHEAIAREESNEFSEGVVIEEFRRGFLLGERLLRPAMVKVSAGPGQPKSNGLHPTDSNEQPETADLGQR